MNKKPHNKKRKTNPTFLNLLSLFAIIFLLTGCSSPKEEDSLGKEVKTNAIPLVISDEYSKMKDGQKFYQIKNSDSLILDIGSYEFVLPDPAFRYIQEDIDYPKMLGGSWAYIDILYDDSSELRGKIVEMEGEGVIYISNVMEKLKEKNIKDFIIAFRFYIDNGEGRQEIDHFPVHIVN